MINISAPGTMNLQSALSDLNTSMEINGPGASQLTVRRAAGGKSMKDKQRYQQEK